MTLDLFKADHVPLSEPYLETHRSRPDYGRLSMRVRLTSSDPVLRKLEGFIIGNLDRQISIDEMARVTATSARTLARKVARGLGISPQRFVQRLRILRAVTSLLSWSGGTCRM